MIFCCHHGMMRWESGFSTLTWPVEAAIFPAIVLSLASHEGRSACTLVHVSGWAMREDNLSLVRLCRVGMIGARPGLVLERHSIAARPGKAVRCTSSGRFMGGNVREHD